MADLGIVAKGARERVTSSDLQGREGGTANDTASAGYDRRPLQACRREPWTVAPVSGRAGLSPVPGYWPRALRHFAKRAENREVAGSRLSLAGTRFSPRASGESDQYGRLCNTLRNCVLQAHLTTRSARMSVNHSPPLSCRVDRGVGHPGPPQIRTCATDASGSSGYGFAARQ